MTQDLQHQSPSAAPQVPANTFIVQVSRPAPERTDIKDVLVGAFGLTGTIVVGAILSGAVLASLWIVWRKWHRTYDHGAPPSLGPVPLSSSTTPETTPPPSSPTQ